MGDLTGRGAFVHPWAMRMLVLAALLVGCGEVSPAGVSIGDDGGVAGSMAGAGGGGSTGDGGTAGAAGAGGTAGGALLPTSCAIPVGQVSGVATDIMWIKCGMLQAVAGGPMVTITDGSAGAFFGEWPDPPVSYTSVAHSAAHPAVGDPTTDGLCSVTMHYDRQGSCTAPQVERLFINMVVSAI